MRLLDLLQFTLLALRRQRFRSLMLLLAVGLGVSAVVVLTALGEGARRYVLGEFAQLGKDTVIVFPGRKETTGGMPPITGTAARSITLEAAAVLAATGISGIAVDSKTAKRPAGTGVPLDWRAIEQISSSISIPLILAGGLTLQNVTGAIERVRPYGVDIISGVEKAPGIKDENRVRRFVRTVKQIRVE